jgi:hypothetical protein
MVDKNRKVGVSQVIHNRNYQRARARALVRLSRLFQNEYKELLQGEREQDEKMGKKWIGIDINTGTAITIESYKDATEGAVDHPSDNRENEGYYGGEERE